LSKYPQAGRQIRYVFSDLPSYRDLQEKSLSLIIAPALRQSQENFEKIQDYINLLPKRPKFHD